MKKFTVYLSREYVVQLEAKNEDDAQTFAALYVSGGFDESCEASRKKDNFKIIQIQPTLNDAFCVAEME
ncbi:MAG: hypothetical protein M0P66_05355 [Salinivirgaceae bacterium]|nr:hypothetical protein [Salinivirgaceae bacterium]